MLLEQKLIQYNFNNAANTYGFNKNIQKITAQRIDEYLTNQYYDENLKTLDLGSGPGTFPEKAENIILYDISLQMLHARTNLQQKSVNGDATKLPFANDSFDLVISNLMLQWISDKTLVLQEIKRVLKDDGVFICTTLVENSLWQLENAWKHLDNHQHIIDFTSQKDYLNLMDNVRLEIISVENWQHTMYFDEIYQLLKHFKLTGTSMPKSLRSKGLGGCGYLTKLGDIYPRHNHQLPLSYNNLLLVVKKRSVDNG